jgi:probable F420-dependent oxidoreductase
MTFGYILACETIGNERRDGLPGRTGLLNPDTAQYAGKAQAKPTIADIAAAARATEALGFDGVYAPEAGHDPFLPLTIAAEHTTTLHLGTNVAIAFPRSPMVTAQLAWDLQQLSGGRFNLGLGTQVKGHNELRYATPWTAGPGPRLREYVQCVQAMFTSFTAGKPTPFEGQHYRFSLLPPFNPGPIDTPRPRSTSPRSAPTWRGSAASSATASACTRSAPSLHESGGRSGDRGRRRQGRRTLADINMIGAPFLATRRPRPRSRRPRRR